MRFTAWAHGSKLPRQYESVTHPAGGAALHQHRLRPARLRAAAADRRTPQRLPQTHQATTPQNTISAGAADASEMGAYARDKNPIRAQALLLKLQEYMPAGSAAGDHRRDLSGRRGRQPCPATAAAAPDRTRYGYTGVVAQQGRVILDRDFNAQQGLDRRPHRRRCARLRRPVRHPGRRLPHQPAGGATAAAILEPAGSGARRLRGLRPARRRPPAAPATS